MNVKNISACGHVAGSGFRRYLSMKDIEKKNWFCNRDGNLFYFYYVCLLYTSMSFREENSPA